MSKISEQKALEAYPPEYEQEDFNETWDMNIQYREPYIEGYNQAMQASWRRLVSGCQRTRETIILLMLHLTN